MYGRCKCVRIYTYTGLDEALAAVTTTVSSQSNMRWMKRPTVDTTFIKSRAPSLEALRSYCRYIALIGVASVLPKQEGNRLRT